MICARAEPSQIPRQKRELPLATNSPAVDGSQQIRINQIVIVAVELLLASQVVNGNKE